MLLQVDGDWNFNSRKSTLEWTIDLVDSSNRTGSMEFVVPHSDPDDFFPVDVTFTCSTLMCEVAIDSVEDPESGDGVKYSFNKVLQTGDYQIV